MFTSNVREAAHRALQNGCRKEELEQRLINLRNLVRRMPADGKVLAAGVGDGYNADEAWNSLGVEKSVAMGEVGKQNCDLFAEDLANITYAATEGDACDLCQLRG